MASMVNDKLSLYLIVCAHKSFSYGNFDCGLFVVDWVKENKITAELPHKNAKGAAKIIKQHGSLALAGQAILTGFGLKNATVSQRGDIGLVKMNHKKLFAISTGKKWISPAEKGLMSFGAIPELIWRLP